MHEDVLKARLEQLKQEKAAGEKQIVVLVERKNDLQNTLLRISGAITVLEEILAEREAVQGE